MSKNQPSYFQKIFTASFLIQCFLCGSKEFPVKKLCFFLAIHYIQSLQSLEHQAFATGHGKCWPILFHCNCSLCHVNSYFVLLLLAKAQITSTAGATKPVSFTEPQNSLRRSRSTFQNNKTNTLK